MVDMQGRLGREINQPISRNRTTIQKGQKRGGDTIPTDSNQTTDEAKSICDI
jgi:hypothetical protein